MVNVLDVETAVRRLAEITDVAVLVRAEARAAADVPAADVPDQQSDPVGDVLVDPAQAVPAISVGAPMNSAQGTLREALERAAETDRGTTYVRPDGSEDHQPYARLLAEARQALTGLRGLGLRPGDSALFQLPDNRQFVTMFWACVLGGFLPTPVSVAPEYTRPNAVTGKLLNAWRLLDHPPIITGDDQRDAVAGLAQLWDVTGLTVAAVGELTTGESAEPHHGDPGDIVLNLLTSGSTGVPKCVQHTNRSLLDRVAAASAANGFGPDDVGLNFMPLDHVGGIVMYNLRDTVLGCWHVSAPLETFLGRPPVLLDWIDKYRATNTWAPNFAFALVNEHADEIERGSWDLSSMTHMCNAGEAVVADVAHRFVRLLTAHRFPRDAMVPCWGMSETSSGVTYSRLDREDASAGVVRVDSRSLGGRLRLAAPDSPHVAAFTEVGAPVPGVELRIVDSDGGVVAEGTAGGLQIRGVTMMTGYFRNDEANRESYTDDGWFRTGDLGFLRDGKLTITGREKDVIIVGGANYVNTEIEPVVEAVDGVRVTWAAACALPDPEAGTDHLGVFFVPESDDPRDWPPVVREIRGRLSREVGLAPRTVVPVSKGGFPKTNSGKIQRAQLLRDLRAGAFVDRLRLLAEAEEHNGDGVRMHAVTWRPVDSTPRTAARSGDVLVLGDDELAAALHGRKVATVASDVPGTVVYRVPDTADPADPEDPEDVLLGVTRLIRSAPSAEIVVVTTGAVWAQSGDEVNCTQTVLPGLVRTGRAEGVDVRLVDLPSGDVAGLLAAELTLVGDPLVAYRNGVRLVPRLRSVWTDSAARPAVVAGGHYLVTGGLGGIGLELAQYLLAAYQVRLRLIGRTPAADVQDRLDGLRDFGEVRYAAVDVTDAAALRDVVANAEAEWGSLTGVLHLAGADVSGFWDDLDRHRIATESPEEFRRVLAPKVAGTLALREVLIDRPAAELVLFSSVNGFFGGGSFGAYAAASSFLDGFADHWGRQLGRPVRCLAWSAWAGIGMNRDSPTALAAARRGFRTITTEEGLTAFLAALTVDEPHLLIGLDPGAAAVRAELDPRGLRSTEVIVAYTASAELDSGVVARAVAASDVDIAMRCVRVATVPRNSAGGVDHERLESELARVARASRPHEEPENDLERQLADVWAEVLGSAPVGRGETFFELGGTSLRAAELVARLNRDLGTRLSARELYQHPTVASLATAIAPTPMAERTSQ